MNQLKTVFWLTLLTLLTMAVGQALGGQMGLILALALAVVGNVSAYYFSDSLVLAAYRARVVSPAEAPELHRIVGGLCRTANLPQPRVAVIDSPTPNAFATGRNPRHAVVAVTTGLLQILDTEEVAGVLGHELAHVKNRDTLISSVAAVLAGAIAYVASMAQWALMFGFRTDDDGDGPGPLGALVMALLAPLAATIIQAAVSRSREFIADQEGARISGRPLALARALQKLDAAAHQIPMNASPATAHMFIVSPLSGTTVSRLFSTHPSTQQRVEALTRMARS